MKYISQNEKSTTEFAAKFAGTIQKGDIICLDGDLGTGKTVFAKAIIKQLGITENVSSPTFTILHEYHGEYNIYHFDLYRITNSEEMYELGFEEYFYSDGICIIEWASVMEELLPRECVRIKIAYGQMPNHREIEVTNAKNFSY